MCQRLNCKPFPEEMYKMAIRCKTCHKGGQRQNAASKHSSWTIPREGMDVLAKHMGLQHDRLATPLTYDINMQHYWSNHERDQLLGASWQPYAHQWRGYSQCNPTLDHADMEKAVRWALLSAKQAAGHPTCTVFVLPGGHKKQPEYSIPQVAGGRA